MRRPRTLIGAAAAAILAATAMAAPVAALEAPESAIVHGIPGVKGDLCVDGKEIKSGFRYGQKVKLGIPAGDMKVVLKPRRNGKCKGKAIAKLKITGDFPKDLTIVARLKKGEPALVIIRDVAPSVAANDSLARLANGSSFGTVDGWITTGIVLTAPNPTFPGIERGHRRGVFFDSGTTVAAWFSKPGKAQSLLLPAVQQAVSGKRHQFVLVGSKARNLRIVKFSTALPT